jgi:hypothetical protein
MRDDVLDLLRERNPSPGDSPPPPVEYVLARLDRTSPPAVSSRRSLRRLSVGTIASTAGALTAVVVAVLALVLLGGSSHHVPTSPRRSLAHGSAGDPANGVLLHQNVFVPYERMSSELKGMLNDIVLTAAKAHFPLKVALISSKADLGIIPQLLGRPKEYALYLDAEISVNSRVPLLVVMKDGYGVAGLPAAATHAAATLSPPVGGTPDDLGQAAIGAVETLAAAARHHPLPGVVTVRAGSAVNPPSAGLKVVGTIQLRSARSTSRASGIVSEQRAKGGGYEITVVANHVAPNTKSNSYAVWLYKPPDKSRLLGFVYPSVGRDGQLHTEGPLPSNASEYTQILVTLESMGNPRAPSPAVLIGYGRLR